MESTRLFVNPTWTELDLGDGERLLMYRPECLDAALPEVSTLSFFSGGNCLVCICVHAGVRVCLYG